jgi:hypothetical protein
MKKIYALLLSALFLCLAGGLSAQDDLTIGLTSANGAVGGTVCVNLVGENFAGISGMQFSIIFDATTLQFVSAMGNINGTNVSMVNRDNAPNVIRVVYSPFSSTGYTDAGPFVIGTICFRVLRAGATNVTIEDAPTPLEFTNDQQETFGPGDVVVNNAVINMGTGGATCTDGIRNGTETGVDCGGSCAPCPTTPTCTDGIRNGTETGVDCGGSCAPCPTTPTCSDGIRNGTETGVDCGGSCAPCPTTPTCSDGIRNGTETGVDCGGSCAPCPTTPTCSDGIQNGNETGIDCGGSNCPACEEECGVGSDRLNICIGDACTVAVGAQACVEITTSNFTSITGFQFDVVYPGARLGFTGFTAAPRFGNLIQVNETSDGSVRMLLFDGSGVGISLNDNDLIGTLCFTNEAAGPTTVNAVGLNFSAVSGNLIGPIANPGSVNGCNVTMPTCTDGIRNGTETGIDCGGNCAPCDTGGSDICGEGSDRLNVCIGDACDVANGGQACMVLTASRFTRITGFQFDVTYPGANLDFVNFTAAAVFGSLIQVNETSDGSVRLLLFDGSGVGVTIADGDAIGTICFTNQTAGVTAVTPRGLNFSSTSGNLIGPIGNSGTVNGCVTAPTCSDGIQNGTETGVDCGGSCGMPCEMTPCGDGTTDVEVCVGSVCGDAGAEVCVPVFIGNFNNLGGVQFSLQFAGANLQFTRFTSHPDLMLGAQVTPPQMGGQAVDGIVNAIWNDPSLQGVTIPGDVPAFEICFTVEVAAATPITFREPATRLRAFGATGTGVPVVGSSGSVNQNCGGNTPTCSDGIRNGTETGIDCGGSCTPCDTGGGNDTCGEGSDRLNICVGDACDVSVGEQFCVDLTASMFTRITGFQLDLTYPGANLDFVSFTAATVFGTLIQVNETSDGSVRLLMFDGSGVGVTIADNDLVGTICFTNQTVGLTVITPVGLNFGAVSGNVIGPVGNAGAINAVGCGAGSNCTNGIRDGNEDGIDCGGDCPTVCPTCDDGIRNGTETGVDCGGACSPCPTNMLSLTAGSGTAQIGQQVCVDVSVADFVNVGSVGLTLSFNASTLSLASLTANSALPGFTAANFNTATAGRIVVNYNPATAQTLANGEALFEVCFNILTGEEAPLTITNATATSGGGTTLMINANNGIINSGGVVEYDNLTLVAGNINGALGTEVCLNVRVFNFTDLAALQFSMFYDITKLRFVSATSTGELPGLQFNPQSDGFIRVFWADLNVNSNNVADGNSIFRLCFNVLEACDAPVEFRDIEGPPPFRLQATNSSNMSISPIDLVDGSVNANIPCGGVEPPANLILNVSSADGTIGTEVCVEVAARNFISLTELDFSLTFDPARVTFTRATGFGLASITAANVTANNTTGRIGFQWDSPISTGQSLPNGASVLSLCFTVNQFAVTPINFANMPRTIRARNATGQNVGVVPSGGSINPNAPTVSSLTFQIGSASAAVGEEICLPIIGFFAVDMVSFQYTINFDPAILQYIGTGPNFAFNGFSAGTVQNPQPGRLTIAWADPLARPNTVQNGQAIYSICFRVLSTNPTLVSFGNSPTAIEFENEDGLISTDLLNGQVNGTPAPVIVEADLGRPSCFGDDDGSISLTVSGNNNLRYVWSPNVSTSRTATNLAAGTYAVTVTNMTSGQSTIGSFDLTNGSLFTLEVASVSGVSCFGEADGSITLAPMNGEGSLLYDWNGSVPDSGPRQNMLAGGSYSVTVTDGNACRRVQSNIMVGAPVAALNIIGSPNNIVGGTGGVNVEVVGGRQPYGYAWSGPGGYASDDEDINDVTIPGTYCLAVSDNRNCIDEQCFAIAQALGASADVNNGCAGQNNASINLTAVGATGAYTYRWTGPGGFTATNTPLIENLSPGDYSVTISSGGQEIVQLIEVEAATPINLTNVTVTPATTGNNGTITLTPTGGNSPYTYLWNDGVTTQNRSALANGQFCVTVTDGSNCTASICYMVRVANASFLSVSTSPPQCNGGSDGSINLIMNNGVAPFRARVTPGTIDQVFNTENIDLTVASGTFRVFVTDAQGAMLDTVVTVAATAMITVTGSVTSDTEDQNCSGMLSLAISGGTSPYSVRWSNGSTGATIATLCAGDYIPTITDANGCVLESTTFTVGRIDEERGTITDVACADGTEGGIMVSVTGGFMPYTFAWRRMGAPEVLSTNEDLLASDVTGGVGPGIYTLTITDATGAVLVKNYTVGITAGFSVTITTTTDYNGFSVSCPGATDGRIEIDISGQGDFMYEYVLDGVMVGVDSVLENAAVGVYTVSVIDDGGCEITRSVTLTAPSPITIGGSATNISCGSTADGTLSVNPSGGVPTYDFLWSTGETTSRISGLEAGTYAVTVTDANACTETASFSLTTPEDLAMTFDATDATEGCNGTIRILPLGGSGVYRYVWPELPEQGNNPFAEGLCPGVYTIRVTDANMCQTVTMLATVLDRRFPCLNARDVITPNGDGLNEKFVIFCSDGNEAINNTLQIFNRWGQRVYNITDYDCSDDDRGTNCFEGRTNDGEVLPEGAYYYIFEFTNLQGEEMQQRGALSIIRE